MKDFPIFDTEFGIASLILREVPYRQEAYVHIQDSRQPAELLKECVGFARMVGAELVYACGHDYLENFPVQGTIWEMRGQANCDPAQVECLWPVTEETVGRWRQMMNERMAGVDNAGTLESRMEKEILASGGAYFVHRDGEVLGGFWLHEGELKLITALRPGMGQRVMHTLMSLIPGQTIRLEVISTNEKALKLYEKLGFVRTAQVRQWHRVHP